MKFIHVYIQKNKIIWLFFCKNNKSTSDNAALKKKLEKTIKLGSKRLKFEVNNISPLSLLLRNLRCTILVPNSASSVKKGSILDCNNSEKMPIK